MSANSEAADEVCASCGKAEVDNIKLRRCTACKLVRYCSVDCQKEHRSQHKRTCKKRASEIRDDLLFTLPDSTCFDDCSICCLPVPIEREKSTMFMCCCQIICNGCQFTNFRHEQKEGIEVSMCPFCREPDDGTDEEKQKAFMERIKANDLNALRRMGTKYFLEGDYKKAFEYHTKAAQLGDASAHYELSVMYYEEKGLKNDKKKIRHHLEEAAIKGHPIASHNLGCNEERAKGWTERAKKHYIIAAKLGYIPSMRRVKDAFDWGAVSEEDYSATLRGHEATVNATKSSQREQSYAYDNLVQKLRSGRFEGEEKERMINELQEMVR